MSPARLFAIVILNITGIAVLLCYAFNVGQSATTINTAVSTAVSGIASGIGSMSVTNFLLAIIAGAVLGRVVIGGRR